MIRAIETTFKGYRFRSRLEARWAVFMDALGIRWEYEAEGFNLPAGPYLPDFWLPYYDGKASYPEGTPPISGIWVEIKPCAPSEVEIARLEQLSIHSHHCAYMLAGNIGDGEFETWKVHPKSGKAELREQRTFEWYVCGHFTLPTEVWAKAWFFDRDEITYHPSSRFHGAFTAARSARFEHGESP